MVAPCLRIRSSWILSVQPTISSPFLKGAFPIPSSAETTLHSLWYQMLKDIVTQLLAQSILSLKQPILIVSAVRRTLPTLRTVTITCSPRTADGTAAHGLQRTGLQATVSTQAIRLPNLSTSRKTTAAESILAVTETREALIRVLQSVMIYISFCRRKFNGYDDDSIDRSTAQLQLATGEVTVLPSM